MHLNLAPAWSAQGDSGSHPIHHPQPSFPSLPASAAAKAALSEAGQAARKAVAGPPCSFLSPRPLLPPPLVFAPAAAPCLTARSSSGKAGPCVWTPNLCSAGSDGGVLPACRRGAAPLGVAWRPLAGAARRRQRRLRMARSGSGASVSGWLGPASRRRRRVAGGSRIGRSGGWSRERRRCAVGQGNGRERCVREEAARARRRP